MSDRPVILSTAPLRGPGLDALRGLGDDSVRSLSCDGRATLADRAIGGLIGQCRERGEVVVGCLKGRMGRRRSVEVVANHPHRTTGEVPGERRGRGGGKAPMGPARWGDRGGEPCSMRRR